MSILAGDIGGTKTELALFKKGEPKKPLRQKKFFNRYYEDIDEVIKDFLSGFKGTIDRACFGVAGPVIDGVCIATNLPWTVDAKKLAHDVAIPHVSVINDLEANAYGLRVLNEKEFYTLNEGAGHVDGHAALISAGTGLGEAGLFWDGRDHIPFPTEGAHVDFAPRNEIEIELLKFLKRKYGHVSFERLVSGMGFPNLYSFLVETGVEKPSSELKEEFEKGDPPKVITEWALKGKSKVCERVVDWFVSLYGSEAGNLALKTLSRGGVYVGGGIAPQILPFFKTDTFMKAFVDKGRFKELLSTIPVKLVLNPNTALLGAMYYAAHH